MASGAGFETVLRCSGCEVASSLSEEHKMGNDPISISFCINDKYAQHLAVVIASVLTNNPDDDFVFHVLHSDVTEASIAKVKELERMYPHHRIEFHRVDAARFAAFHIPANLEHVTREMYYRFSLPDVLASESRTIYSDVDVLVVGKIRPLWELNLRGNLLAAVSEGESGEFKKRLLSLDGPAPYFYSGLLLLDLEKMRREGCVRKLFENTTLLSEKLAWPDQDVINCTFRNRILQLGAEWDGINVRYSPFRNDIAIWHFPGATMKPWCNIWKNRTWPAYLKYLLRSPYRDMAIPFVWGHIKGFFFFKYTKNRVERYLVCGIRVWRKRIHN